MGYNGKMIDVDTGQYNYGYRDYTPTAGCFSTVDPIKDGTSWYDYCGNDPVNFVDLWGLDVYVGYDDLADYKINGKPLGNVGEHVVHSTIIITDDNGNAEQYFESYGKPDEKGILRNTRDTENALRDSRFEEEGLTPSDQNGDWQEQFSNGLFKKDPPPGLTTEEYENAIKETASRYDNSDPYFPVPILKPGSSNSNSYVGTILRDTFYESLTEETFEKMTAQAISNMIKKHTPPDVSGAVGWNKEISLKNK